MEQKEIRKKNNEALITEEEYRRLGALINDSYQLQEIVKELKTEDLFAIVEDKIYLQVAFYELHKKYQNLKKVLEQQNESNQNAITQLKNRANDLNAELNSKKYSLESTHKTFIELINPAGNGLEQEIKSKMDEISKLSSQVLDLKSQLKSTELRVEELSREKMLKEEETIKVQDELKREITDYEDENKQLENKLNILVGTNAELDSRILEYQKENQQLKETCSDFEDKLSATKKELEIFKDRTKLTKELATLREEISQLKSKITRLEKEHRLEKEQLKKRIEEDKSLIKLSESSKSAKVQPGLMQSNDARRVRRNTFGSPLHISATKVVPLESEVGLNQLNLVTEPNNTNKLKS